MYEDFYGFSERPFQLTPDPSFYFESVTHKKALTYLSYGLDQGEGFIVITGEVGAGKSTLVGHLRNRLDWNSVTVGEVVTSALGSDEMIAMAAHSFGLEVDNSDKSGALSAIELFLQDEARAGRKVLLVVDEAQNLTVGALEELRMLSNFHLGAQPLLQMLLLGQPEFKTLLSEWDQLEQLRQRVIASHHLEAMQQGEIEPYVMHRLDHVGYKLKPRFEGDVWKRIYHESRGIPRLVNRIMSRVLMKGAVDRREVIDDALVEHVIDEMNGRVSAEPPMSETDPRRQTLAVQPTRGPEPIAAVEDRSEDQPAPAAELSSSAYEEALPASIPEAISEEPMPETTASSGDTALLDAQIEAIEHAFMDRDKAIAALRKEVADLTQERAEQTGSSDVDDRLKAIEKRLDHQERSLRQVLTMMINYFENSASRNAA